MSDANVESTPASPAGGMRAVTVSREYGSGGGEIAARIAERLGWSLVDHHLVAEVAATLNEPEERADACDERSGGLMAHLIDAVQLIAPWSGAVPGVTAEEEHRRHYQALCEVVRSAADAGNVVIVGRGSQAILAGRRDVLNLRVIAPIERRVAYVAQREGLSEDDARARIRGKDHDRAVWLQTFEGVQPNDPHLYDLTINTGVLPLDVAVQLALDALAGKASRLSAPESELGPGAGLSPYPAPPSELWAPRAEP
jgi:cytidylate kinase